MIRWILLGFVLLLMIACGGENPLANTEWRLVAIAQDNNINQVIGDPDIKFSGDEFGGGTGCNGYGGMYRVRGSTMYFTGLMWQERGCPTNELFEQEQLMQEILAGLETFEISGDELRLSGPGGNALIFERNRKAS